MKVLACKFPKQKSDGSPKLTLCQEVDQDEIAYYDNRCPGQHGIKCLVLTIVKPQKFLAVFRIAPDCPSPRKKLRISVISTQASVNRKACQFFLLQQTNTKLTFPCETPPEASESQAESVLSRDRGNSLPTPCSHSSYAEGCHRL
jgi:hypothetical protein